MNIELQYLSLLGLIGDYGSFREGRNGGTYSLFGAQMRHDMKSGFPLLTTKRVHFKSIVVELLWFLRGDTNIKFLHDYGVTIWDEWADENGDLGPVYGKQWRSWPDMSYNSELGLWGTEPIDQIAKVIEGLKKDPFSRRHIVTAWNPAEVDEMALPPCHCLFQFYVSEDGDMPFLDLQLYQRSADMFLGVPFNIASYSLLLHLVAREVGMIPRYFVHTLGDLHIYDDHLEQVSTQLSREPRDLPLLEIVGGSGIFDLNPEDIVVRGYDPHPTIKAEVRA